MNFDGNNGRGTPQRVWQNPDVKPSGEEIREEAKRFREPQDAASIADTRVLFDYATSQREKDLLEIYGDYESEEELLEDLEEGLLPNVDEPPHYYAKSFKDVKDTTPLTSNDSYKQSPLSVLRPVRFLLLPVMPVDGFCRDLYGVTFGTVHSGDARFDLIAEMLRIEYPYVFGEDISDLPIFNYLDPNRPQTFDHHAWEWNFDHWLKREGVRVDFNGNPATQTKWWDVYPNWYNAPYDELVTKEDYLVKLDTIWKPEERTWRRLRGVRNLWTEPRPPFWIPPNEYEPAGDFSYYEYLTLLGKPDFPTEDEIIGFNYEYWEGQRYDHWEKLTKHLKEVFYNDSRITFDLPRLGSWYPYSESQYVSLIKDFLHEDDPFEEYFLARTKKTFYSALVNHSMPGFPPKSMLIGTHQYLDTYRSLLYLDTNMMTTQEAIQEVLASSYRLATFPPLTFLVIDCTQNADLTWLSQTLDEIHETRFFFDYSVQIVMTLDYENKEDADAVEEVLQDFADNTPRVTYFGRVLTKDLENDAVREKFVKAIRDWKY